MNVSRRQFFALVGAGAAASLLPLELTNAEATPVPKVSVNGARGKAFRVVEAQYGMSFDGPMTMHVKGFEVDGYMEVSFDMLTEKMGELRLNDIVYIDTANFGAAWPLPLESTRGEMTGLQEMTLTIPPLAEREAMEAWRDER